MTCREWKDVIAGPGIACNVNGLVGPTLYSAFATEHGASPNLRPADARVLSEILRRHPPRNIRFLYVGSDFLVFEATRGACGGGGIYNLLNVPCGGYSPSDFDTPQKGIVPGSPETCGHTTTRTPQTT